MSEPAIARTDEPSVVDLLDVDRVYRDRASRNELKKIAPKRLNQGQTPGYRFCMPVAANGTSPSFTPTPSVLTSSTR